MLASYAATAVLAGMGGKRRAHESPAVPLVFLAKAVADVAVNLKLARAARKENAALCGYCQAATWASVASFVLAMPEALDAWRVVRDSTRALGLGAGRLQPATARVLH